MATKRLKIPQIHIIKTSEPEHEKKPFITKVIDMLHIKEVILTIEKTTPID